MGFVDPFLGYSPRRKYALGRTTNVTRGLGGRPDGRPPMRMGFERHCSHCSHSRRVVHISAGQNGSAAAPSPPSLTLPTGYCVLAGCRCVGDGGKNAVNAKEQSAVTKRGITVGFPPHGMPMGRFSCSRHLELRLRNGFKARKTMRLPQATCVRPVEPLP